MRVEDLHSEDKVDLDLASGTKGVVVSDVLRGSPAAQAGIEPGDLIQEVDGKEVAEAGAFRTALDSSAGKPVQMLIDRAGDHFFVAVQNH